MKAPPLILCLLLGGCIATEQDGLDRLKPGSWVEAKGRMLDGKPVVDKLDELKRADSDKADKVDITGAIDKSSPDGLEVIGLALKTDAETEYENADKQAIDKFEPKVGDTLRIKLRHKDDEFRVRTLRQSEARDGFKVEGEILAVDRERAEVTIGGIKLPLNRAANVSMIGDRRSSDPLALFQADDQKAVPFSIAVGTNLRLGGGVSGSCELDDEYDLTRTVQRDRTKTSAQAKIDGLWLFDDNASYAMLELSTGRSDTMPQNGPDTHRDILEVTRAFGSVRLVDGVQLLVGRQDFTEERKWLFNEVLDAVRLMYADGHVEADIGIGTGRQIAAENNATEDTHLFLANARYALAKDWLLSAYALKRTDATQFDHEPELIGVRSIEDARYGLGHWADLGFARGHSRFGVNAAGANSSVLDTVEDIRGWAFDVGAIYTFETDLRPSVAIGYAYATGEKDSSTHQGYRQTGYQDNSDKLGGVTSVRYYGELYRPELTNVAILTLAASFRPTSNSSISGLFHTYTQDYANRQAPLNDLRIGSSGSSPNGFDPELGYEFDLVFGYRAARHMTVEVVGAHFEPGAAYTNQDAANKLDITARLSF